MLLLLATARHQSLLNENAQYEKHQSGESNTEHRRRQGPVQAGERNNAAQGNHQHDPNKNNNKQKNPGMGIKAGTANRLQAYLKKSKRNQDTSKIAGSC